MQHKSHMKSGFTNTTKGSVKKAGTLKGKSSMLGPVNPAQLQSQLQKQGLPGQKIC